MRVTAMTASAPWLATIGTRTTAMAPVGPEICRWDPPKTAARKPATMAVMRPCSAVSPELTPKPRASGQGDDADGGTGEEVLRPGAAGLTVVGERRQQADRHAAAAEMLGLMPYPAPGIFGRVNGLRRGAPHRLRAWSAAGPGHREQLGGAAVGEAVVDMAGPPFGFDEAVPAQHGQMLRQMRGLEFGLGLEIGDADLLGAGEELEDADAPGVGEALEEVRLDLVQGTLRADSMA
jgi:hypothetical protein